MALRVYGDGYDMIYDFGRYGATWGGGGSKGEGQLRAWDDFQSYIARENATGRTTTSYEYETSAEQDQAIVAYYAALVADLKPNKVRKHMKQYRISDYDAANNNCVTMSSAGLGTALPGVARAITDPKYNEGRGLSLSERLGLSVTQNGSRVVLPLDLQQGILGAGGYIGTTTYPH